MPVLNFNGSYINVELSITKMSDDYRTVDLLTGLEKSAILNRVKLLSEVIVDREKLSDFWSNEYRINNNKYVSSIYFRNKLFGRISKRLPFLKTYCMSNNQILELLNILRCDSHRNYLINLLENRYDNIK